MSILQALADQIISCLVTNFDQSGRLVVQIVRSINEFYDG